MKKISIISNDKRYVTTNSLFLANGYESKIETPVEFCGCDILILSVKNEYNENELKIIFEKIGPNTIIFKGNYKIPEVKGNIVYNYSTNEEFVLKNARLTSIAALMLAKENSKNPISSSKVLVLGYGRIGKYLAEMLKERDAETYVYARRDEVRHEAEKNGIIALDKIKDLHKYAFVFNTVPEIIVSKDKMDKVHDDTLIIELASAPGGFEDKSKVLDGKGLPGKMLPTYAGEAVYEIISKILSSNVVERTIL